MNPDNGVCKENYVTGVLAGVAGEYYVAAELSKRGYIASITLRNSKGVDVLCSNANATKSVGIQVKTCSGKATEWILNQKAEDYFANNLFYVFVSLNHNQAPPNFHIVPSKVVAVFAKECHARWLATPGRNGLKHKDGTMRKFIDREKKYQNRWDLLGI
jgi:hypothetical protein